MGMFIRRFLFDPGDTVLLEIESVNILDLEPPAAISGVGTGTVICVGEYENGAYNTPTQVGSATDFVNTFGELGYNYAGVPGNNPSARSRTADGALTAEYWNGNAFVQLNAKRFSSMICVRVDTSVGAVQMNRQAYVTGAAAFRYVLTSGQILSLDIGAAPVSATFTGVAAVLTSGSGTYPTFSGGETLTIGYDDAANFQVTFLSTDTTRAAVVARINTYAGFTFAGTGSGTTITLTSIRKGTGGQVRVVSGSSGVLTALGLSAGTTIGTGNVSDIGAVTFPEIKSIVQAAVSGTLVEQDSQGRLRISKVYVASGDYITVGTATTATGLGFAVGLSNSNTGYAALRTTAGTYPTGFTGGETLTLGVDAEANFTVTFSASATTQAQVIIEINAAAGYTMAVTYSSTVFIMRGRANGGQVRVVAASAGAVTTALGLSVQTTIISSPVLAGSIPAGTVLSNTANTNVFVLTKSIAITVATVGAYTGSVRHALDDGTGVLAASGTIVVVQQPPDLGSFSVVNAVATTAALTETQIDAAYVTALASTIDLGSIARVANIVISARQSNTVRRAIRANVLDASANGMFGRIGIVRPPLGTAKALAKSGIAEPGVGATRDQRVVYCYPGYNTFVPIIGARGTAGGAGFTADGNVNVGADALMASICSQLPPEENPGQDTPFATSVNSLETTGVTAGWGIDDYKQFKAAGIAALRIDDGVAAFQSGVTSVDPLVYPGLKNIARRRMADYIQDSLGLSGKAFGKKLSTDKRRKALNGQVVGFLSGLLSKDNPDKQRIASYSVNPKAGNTATTLGQGLYRLVIKVRTLASLDSIVFQTTIGEQVTVDEVAPQAA